MTDRAKPPRATPERAGWSIVLHVANPETGALESIGPFDTLGAAQRHAETFRNVNWSATILFPPTPTRR